MADEEDMSRPERGRGKRDSERPSWGDTPPDGVEGGFTCAHCGAFAPYLSHGTSQRNHCPHCLWSLHVDLKPGDRQSRCKSPMEPVAIWVSEGGEWRLFHRCSGCGVLKPNRIAGDDSEHAIQALVDRVAKAKRL